MTTRHRGEFPLTLMCRVLGVARSASYAWARRGRSRRQLLDREFRVALTGFHAQSRRSYGRPRLVRDLQAAGYRVGQERVRRLMREAGVADTAALEGQARAGSGPRLDSGSFRQKKRPPPFQAGGERGRRHPAAWRRTPGSLDSLNQSIRCGCSILPTTKSYAGDPAAGAKPGAVACCGVGGERAELATDQGRSDTS